MSKYSVLMAVYKNDDPLYFRQAAESILAQTVCSDDIVLVCDGPVYGELKEAVESYRERFNIIKLEKNVGLGMALNEGLKHCKHDLVARMDSDDISLPERCEKEISAFEKNQDLGIVSGTVNEFTDDPSNVICKRVLPASHGEIVKFSKKRCPFNHPAVMFKKSAVASAGGYTENYHYFEDYDLWIRMLKNGTLSYNIQEPLLLMRVSDEMYLRRGGKKYAKDLLRFHNHLRKTGWISLWIFISCAVAHAVVCVLPNGIRKKVYKKLRDK